MKLQFAVLMLAGLAGATPITVTGAGTFQLDNFKDTSANVCFSGAGVAVCANGVPIGPAPPTSLVGSTRYNPSMRLSSATVDDMTSNLYALSLGGDSGFLDILDSGGNVLAEEEICGFLLIASYEQFGTRWLENGAMNDNWWARGTFRVEAGALIPTPEPAAGMLAGLGLAALMLARRGKERT